MDRIGVTGLVRIDLPDATVIRLAEGADVRWSAETYLASDPDWGAIGSIEALGEGVGVEVPAMQLTLLPPSTAAAATLVQPGVQKARVRLWLAQWDMATGTVTDAGAALFDGFLDQATLTRGPGRFELALSVVAALEHLFELQIGNWLSPTFHKLVWPGETGEDHATGLSLPDAWGVEAPTPGYVGGAMPGKAPWAK